MDDFDLKRITKGFVAHCIRNNTSLEDYHTKGIPITDTEMKTLMKEIVNNTYFYFSLLYHSSGGHELFSKLMEFEASRYAADWDDPDELNINFDMVVPKILNQYNRNKETGTK